MTDLYVGLVDDKGQEFAGHVGSRPCYPGPKGTVVFLVGAPGRVAGAFLTGADTPFDTDRMEVFPFSSGTLSAELFNTLKVTVNPKFKAGVPKLEPE